jgi:membrane-associated phospholipid phosphatase
MTEIPISDVRSGKGQFGHQTFAKALVLFGRVLALSMAFFVVRSVVASSDIGVGTAQPLGIAGILLVAACARRSVSTLLAVGYVLMFLVFLILRPVADETFIPVHYDFPILMDRILFLGALPMVWLQDLFYVPGRVGVLDFVMSSVYITYFFAPHVTALVVWRTRPQLFPRAIVAISLTFMIGLFFYFAVPTAPPWLASERGDIDSDIVRILPEISAQMAGDTYDEASRAVGENDVAAMPSLHTALTAMVALILAGYGRRWRWVGITYVALMGTALVYLGEHYIIDEIAGVALAFGVWRLVSRHRAFAWLSAGAEVEKDVGVEVAAERRAA